MSTEEPAADSSAAVEVEAVGVDEIVRQERVRSIFDARAKCREKRTRVKNRISAGEPKNWLVVYRNSLETYIREVEPLFEQTDEGREIWNEIDFGAIDLRPSYEDIHRSSKVGPVPRQDIHARGRQPLVIRLRGLRSLFDIDTPYRCNFDVSVPSKRLGRSSAVKTVSVERYVPMRSLDQMFSAVNRYLGEIGFGIQVSKAQQNTKLDDGLMKEVEQWRRENL